MKKSLVSLLVVLFTLSIAMVAMASPVTLDGSASVQYRHNSHNQWPNPAGNDGDSGNFTKLIINGQTKLDSNFKLYARFGMQGVSNMNAQPADFNTSAYSGDYAAAIDQYGLIYSNGGFTYKLGRQDATIGGTALLYNNNFMVGKNAFVDGISITGKTGVVSVKAIAAKENGSGFNGADNNANNKILAISASTNINKDLVVGTTVARYNTDNGNTNHYALNAAYNYGKATFSGEVAKSNAATDNKAYDVGVNYQFNPKVSAFMTYVRVEANGDMGGKTDFENDMKGIHYGAAYNFTKDTTMDVFVINDKGISDKTQKYSSIRTTLTVKF